MNIAKKKLFKAERLFLQYFEPFAQFPIWLSSNLKFLHKRRCFHSFENHTKNFERQTHNGFLEKDHQQVRCCGNQCFGICKSL